MGVRTGVVVSDDGGVGYMDEPIFFMHVGRLCAHARSSRSFVCFFYFFFSFCYHVFEGSFCCIRSGMMVELPPEGKLDLE